MFDFFQPLGHDMSKNILDTILRSSRTVFSFKELILLGKNIKAKSLRWRLNYYVKKGKLYHIRRGLYAKDKDYDRLEAGTKIMTPSYISFETVLVKAGIIFQYYESIFIASTHSRTIVADRQEYVFRKIKRLILTNSKGVEIREAYSIATPERAFLDLIYLNNDYYLDNPHGLNWDLVFDILPIYVSKKMNKTVHAHYSEIKHR